MTVKILNVSDKNEKVIYTLGGRIEEEDKNLLLGRVTVDHFGVCLGILAFPDSKSRPKMPAEQKAKYIKAWCDIKNIKVFDTTYISVAKNVPLSVSDDDCEQ